jgi:hypothetical protein
MATSRPSFYALRELWHSVLSPYHYCFLRAKPSAPAPTRTPRRGIPTPMSLVDACLVRLSELHSDCQVFILDAGFRRYRRNGRQVIPLLAPE